MSLRGRLAVAAGVVVVVLVASGVFLPKTLRASEVAQLDRQLRASAPVAALLATRRPTSTPAPALVPRDLARDSPLSDLYVARLSGARRSVVARSQEAGDRAPAEPGRTTSFDEPLSPVTVGSVSGDGSWRAIRLETLGATVLIAVPLDRVDATVRRMTLAVAGADVAVLAAMALAGWWLVRLGLRPIAEVTGVADAIAAGDRTRRVRPMSDGTEASRLAEAFNVMLDEQQDIERRLRQFVADASHELRTPVAAIGGFADLWREGMLEDRDLGDVMRRIGQESVRMRGLVEDVLLLARLEDGAPLLVQDVDLAEVVADAALDASATHPSRRVTIVAPASVVVVGDDARLRQVVANLVENALVHAGPDASVTVRVERVGASVELVVEDDGVGMSPDEVVRAFDRFWRADGARRRAGTGLGLAIVHSIMLAHGGQVTLSSTPGQGTTSTVVLPVDGPGDLQQTRAQPGG